MRIIFLAAEWLTLLFDVYLLLALVAVNMMKVQYLYLLPPFNFEFARSTPRFVYVWLVLWTGLLAVGCLYSTKRRVSGRPTSEH
ncbi:MAG: hypothetical protein P8N76_11280 [Pirellulaceae bacterium]|nr:hypothetical protein [Pirellulaceae bacterium]